MGRSGAGYSCAGRLRRGWEDGSRGVSRWRVVDLAIIRWRRDVNNVGRCTTRYPGARRLRWGWKNGSRGVPRRRVVDLAIIQRGRGRNNVGRRSAGSGYTRAGRRRREGEDGGGGESRG